VRSAEPGLRLQGLVNSALTAAMLVCVGIILVSAALRWRRRRAETAATGPVTGGVSAR